MAIQIPNLGTAPAGTGGDTSRSAMTKIINNFSDNTNAASRLVGTASGNVMEVGAFGVGGNAVTFNYDNIIGGAFQANASSNDVFLGSYSAGVNIPYVGTSFGLQIGVAGLDSNAKLVARIKRDSVFGSVITFYGTNNTTVDSNGFIKSASPIVKLFADKIEANEEALEQNPVFEKVGVGHYLVKNTEGFAKEGWWIEVPTDTNGNKICAVEYQALENGDLEIKTFKKKLNEDGDIVANLDAPIDIPNNVNSEPRWIDIRLHSTPKPVVHKVPRTEKQQRMVQQIKYAPQLTYITKYEDLFDDAGNPVVVDGKNYQKPVTHIQTDQNGTPILTSQPVVNEKGDMVFEWVQAVDSEGKPIFDDVSVLDADGNQLFDEVIYEPEQ